MPKITRLSVTSLEHVLPPGKGYGNARGVNNRRNCSLIALETDGGVIGIGDAAGPLGVIREYIKLLTPFFVGQSLYDFDIIAAGIRNRLYHFGSQGPLRGSARRHQHCGVRRDGKDAGRAGARPARRTPHRQARLLRHMRLFHR